MYVAGVVVVLKHSSSVVRCQEKLFYCKIKYEDIEYVYIILKHKCKLGKKRLKELKVAGE